MAIAITVPRLGWSMEEGVFAGWLKQDGDAVRAGEPLFSLEGEKATQDVESIDSGCLMIPPTAPALGETVKVGAVIGYLVGAGGVAPPDLPSAVAVAETIVRSVPKSVEPTVERGHQQRLRSTPLARRIARELGVDWTGLAGSGNSGRIRKADVLNAAKQATRNEDAHSIPISQARRAIAGRMVLSGRTTAPVTLTTTIDATNLVSLRRQFKDAGPLDRGVPSLTDFFIKLSGLALRNHPLLNSRWVDDRIGVSKSIHIGLAVDAEAGLIVPVVRDVQLLGLGQIAERTRDLIEKVREQRFTISDVSGGTFTITNLGAFGVEAFTPIINPPECAILGLGRIARQPVIMGDQVVPRDRMSLSLTFDHRIIDGAPAARFVQELAAKVENPGPWLIS